MTEDDIRQYFETFGKIVAITRLTEKDTGKPRGFGFVEFDDYDPVDKAILKQNHQIKGKRVDVKKAVSKQEMNSMGGGGGDFGAPRGRGRGRGGGGFDRGGRGGFGGKNSLVMISWNRLFCIGNRPKILGDRCPSDMKTHENFRCLRI